MVAILLTGHYSRRLFGFVEGVLRLEQPGIRIRVPVRYRPVSTF
jgi:hypothetical protein